MAGSAISWAGALPGQHRLQCAAPQHRAQHRLRQQGFSQQARVLGRGDTEEGAAAVGAARRAARSSASAGCLLRTHPPAAHPRALPISTAHQQCPSALPISTTHQHQQYPSALQARIIITLLDRSSRAASSSRISWLAKPRPARSATDTWRRVEQAGAGARSVWARGKAAPRAATSGGGLPRALAPATHTLTATSRRWRG